MSGDPHHGRMTTPPGRVSKLALALDRHFIALVHLVVIELADWNTALYVMITTIKETSLGDCHRKSNDPRYTKTYSCDYSYTLDAKNYVETIKPVHYYSIAGVLFGVNTLALVAFVITRANILVRLALPKKKLEPNERKVFYFYSTKAHSDGVMPGGL